MRKVNGIFLLSFIFQFFPLNAVSLAGDEMIPYPARIPYRMIRGVTNVGLGWLEILLRPAGEHQTESFSESISQGAANTLIRFTAGLTDISTFWVPDMQMLDIYPDWQGWPYLFHWS